MLIRVLFRTTICTSPVLVTLILYYKFVYRISGTSVTGCDCRPLIGRSARVGLVSELWYEVSAIWTCEFSPIWTAQPWVLDYYDGVLGAITIWFVDPL